MISTLLILALSSTPVAQKAETVQAPSAGAEIAAALEAAARKNQRVLLVWGEAASERSQQLETLLAKNREVARKLQHEYRMVRVKTAEDGSTAELAKKYGVTLESGAAHLTVLAADGSVLAQQPAADLIQGEKPDPSKLLALLEQHQTPRQEAKALLDGALAKAGAEQKRVFLIFESPSCDACHALDARMILPEVRPLLEKEFVACWVDLERNPGAKELQEGMRGARAEGTPWYAVLAADGSAVVDSDDLTGKNIGCPKSAEELEAWGAFLKRARQHLSEEEVGQVVAAFRKAGERGAKPEGLPRSGGKPKS